MADLRDLGVRLLALHAAVLDFVRHAYEETHGPTNAAELLRLLIDHQQFAWLRPLSALVARIDEALEAREAIPDADVDRFFEAAESLLRSGEGDAFQGRYRDTLQQSPEVVMAHANVVKILPRRGPG